MFGEGIYQNWWTCGFGVKLDIVDKAGAWFSYGDSKIGQGRENSKVFLKDNKRLQKEIENKKSKFNGCEWCTNWNKFRWFRWYVWIRRLK